MKKVLYTLVFLCLFMLPAMAGYTVDSIAVTAEVSENGKTQVSTAFTLTFDSLENSVTIPLPDGKISNISAGDFRYNSKKTDAGTNVIVSSRGGFQGTQSFLISYSLPAADDSDDEQDLYQLNLLSTRWEKDIGSVSYQITLPPASVAIPEGYEMVPEVTSGYHGVLDSGNATSSVTGTLVSGSISKRMAYDSLSVAIPLPEGYFYVRSASIPVISVTWLSFAMLVVLALCMVYWRQKLYTKITPARPRLMAPEGVLPCQISQVLDGSTCDVAMQVLEWANLGYLAFKVGKKGQVMMIRRIPMGSERSAAEQKLFRQIFSGGDRIMATPGRFSGAAARFRAASRRKLNRESFDRRGGNVVFVQLPCRVLLAVSIGYAAMGLLPDAAGFVVLAVLAGFIGFVYSVYLHSAVSAFVSRREYTPLSLVIFALMGLLVLMGLLSGGLIEMGLGLCACLFSGAATAVGPRRNQRGKDLLTQTRGCRMFYRQVTWQKLQILQGRNTAFFQKQLPRVIALNSDKVFAARFERLPIPRPEWLPGKSGSMTAQNLRIQVLPIVKALRETFQ